VALDEASGKKLWRTYMAPSGYSGAAVWGSTPVIDATRNSVYVGTGNNYSVPEAVKTCFANNQNNPDCAASNDYFDSVVSLDLTGQINWATRTLYYDGETTACDANPAGVGNCPSPEGPDYDFGGSGPNMLGSDLIGIGQKSGIYWALNPDTGTVVWQTPGRARLRVRRHRMGHRIRRNQHLRSDLKLGIPRLLASAGGREGERRLLGGVEPEQRPDHLADCNAWRMFAGGFRLRARLHGARAGKRRQRGRVRRFDGQERGAPDDVRP